MNVLIAGAGIGGLTAALSLHAAGIEVTVVESARQVRPLGVGINLLPHAVRELTELGLATELAALGSPIHRNVYVDHTGRRLWTEPRGTAAGYRWNQYAVHRGALQLMLLDAVHHRLGPTAVRTATRLDALDQPALDEAGPVEPAGPTDHRGGRVRARLADRERGTVAEVDADVLVGADGLHSRVLRELHPAAAPRWSGASMWRGLGDAPPFLGGDAMTVVAGPDATRVIAYPVRDPETGDRRTNWVALATTGRPGPLAGSPAGTAAWNEPGTVAEILPHLGGWHLDWLDVRRLVATTEGILRYPMVDRDPLDSWTTGRVTLLGDAAHLMYPIGANGASQAIVDARTLAYHLATADPATALARYEAARRPATAATVRANRAMDARQRAAAGQDAAARGAALADITTTYRRDTVGDAADAINTRPSLTPPSP